MIEYPDLNEGRYKKDELTEQRIWNIFTGIFDMAISIKVASYKFALIHSILECIEIYPSEKKFSFNQIFKVFTEIYWRLIIRNQLFQISGNTLSSVYKTLMQFLLENPKYRNSEFESINDNEKDYLLENVSELCSRNVFGALFGDSKELLYSFNKKERFIELNPYIYDFLKNNMSIIRKVNAYEWLKFQSLRNPDRIIKIDLFESKNKKKEIPTFEGLWKEIRAKFSPMDIIYTLKNNIPNQILEINDEKIVVKTEKGIDIVNTELIKKAWENLINDGILFRDDYEKSTYRSSFILALLSQFDFVEFNSKDRISLKLKKDI